MTTDERYKAVDGLVADWMSGARPTVVKRLSESPPSVAGYVIHMLHSAGLQRDADRLAVALMNYCPAHEGMDL